MAADEEEKLRRDLGQQEEASAKKPKRAPAPALVPLLEDLKKRATGLTGAALETEISRFVDAVIERHVAAVPPGLRETVREQLYAMVSNDPTVGAVLDDLRSAVTRG